MISPIKSYLCNIMKKVLKTGVLLLVLVLYCFTVSLYSHDLLRSNTAFSGQSSEVKSYFSLASVNLFSHTIRTENSVNYFYHRLSSSLKSHLNDFLFKGVAVDSFLLKTFSKYIFYSRVIIVGFLQTDIIFPFHYFW